MSKVLVIGGRGHATESLIKSPKEKYGGDVIQANVAQGEPLTLGQMPGVNKSSPVLSGSEWRGGSRGKGGKTKWQVRK